MDTSKRKPRNPTIVIVCTFFTMFLGSSQISSSGILYIAILEHYDTSPTLTAWIGALFTSMFSFGGIICSGVINTFDTRVCVITGGILNLLGFVASGLSPTVYILFLTYGLIAGIGQAMCYGGCFMIVGFYFKRYRSLAFGVIATGFAIGQTVFPTLTQILLENYGLNGTFLLLGAIGFQVCVFGAIVLPHPLEVKVDTNKNMHSKKHHVNAWIHNYVSDHIEVIRTPSFFFLMFSFLCWNKSLAIFTLFLTDYYHETGSTLLEASYLTSVVGIGSIISRILSGMAVVDGSVDGKILYFGSYSVLGISTLLLPLYGVYLPGKIYYSLAYGLYTGGTWPLMNQITVDLVGIHKLAIAYSLETFMAGVGFLVGPVIGSKILEVGGSYISVFIYAGSMYMLASILGILMASLAPKSENIKEKTIEIFPEDTEEEKEITERSLFIQEGNKSDI